MLLEALAERCKPNQARRRKQRGGHRLLLRARGWEARATSSRASPHVLIRPTAQALLQWIAAVLAAVCQTEASAVARICRLRIMRLEQFRPRAMRRRTAPRASDQTVPQRRNASLEQRACLTTQASPIIPLSARCGLPSLKVPHGVPPVSTRTSRVASWSCRPCPPRTAARRRRWSFLLASLLPPGWWVLETTRTLHSSATGPS